MLELNYSGHAIDTFAQALGLQSNEHARAALNEPILIDLDDARLGFADAIEALARSTARLIVCVDHSWLEEHYADDHGYSQPMARAYELIGDTVTGIPIMLHHARDGRARICSADLTKAYVTLVDGGGCWDNLSLKFRKNAAPGIERAGSYWFWAHDALTTQDIISVMQELDTEERLGLQNPLPGVRLNLGRPAKSKKLSE